jgi:elongator complex protein 1
VDANTLFDIALGMYDFGLVLLVAQRAQKDPREYLPFLRHLRALPSVPAQRFAIDDHLRRYESALGHLCKACNTGEDRFEEAMTYAATHRLLPQALGLWRGSERDNDVMAAYADDLFERREFKQAALGKSRMLNAARRD